MARVLDDPHVRAEIHRAWLESRPGSPNALEQGGFILKRKNGTYVVERWPSGTKHRIRVPAHHGGKRGELLIVASFHTHPLVGRDYPQGPSLKDVLGVVGDEDLQHDEYEGEYVISSMLVYLVRPTGIIDDLGLTERYFGKGG